MEHHATLWSSVVYLERGQLGEQVALQVDLLAQKPRRVENIPPGAVYIASYGQRHVENVPAYHLSILLNAHHEHRVLTSCNILVYSQLTGCNLTS